MRQKFADLGAGKLLASGNVKKSARARGQQFPTGSCCGFGGDRASEFICEETQPLSALPCVANLFVEAPITSGRDAAVERGADDEVTRICENNPLGGDFCFGVDAQGIHGVGLDVIAFASIEDEVGGEEDEGNIRRKFSEQGGGFDVGFAGERGIRLAILSARHRGAVDDGSGLLLAECLTNGVGVEEIK